MTKFILSTFALLCITLGVSAQNLKEPENSGTLVNDGVMLLRQESYQQAIDKFNKVARSDTNYSLAQLNVVICYAIQEDWKSIKPVAKQMLFDFDEYDTDFYKYYVRALFNLKEWKTAKKVILAGQKEYPLYHRLQVMEAMCYKGEGNRKKAEELLKKIIKTHSFSADAHYELGKMAAEDGRVVRAIMSINFAIASDNSMNHLGDAYSLLENLCNNNHTPDSKITEADKKEFKEVYELIESGIALKAKYQSDLGLNYSLSKQIDLLIKSVEYNKDSKDFWMQYYVPLLSHMRKSDLVAGYTLIFLRVNRQAPIVELVNKNKKDINEAVDYLTTRFIKKAGEIHYPVNGKTYDLPYVYGSGNNLYGCGKRNSDDKREGNWILFNLKGQVIANLNYDNGELAGKNQWFDEYGKLNGYYTVTDGKIEKEGLFSYDSGIRRYKAQFKDSELHGEVTNYYRNGLQKEVLYFNEGKRVGPYEEFNYAGDVVGSGIYEDGKLAGKYKEFYDNGALYVEMNFKDGWRDGNYTMYYRNGQIKKKGQYKKGKEVGKWEKFHQNGQLELYYTLTEKGKGDGKFFELFENGDTSRTGWIKKGKLHGMDISYTQDGKLYCKQLYKKGVMKTYQYFDSLGNILSEGKKKYVVAYDKYGYKYYEGKLKGKKGRDGVWKYYYKNGNISKTITYKKGSLEGELKWFYESGKLDSKVNFVDDEREGLYVEYYENGNLKKEGWYIKGNKEGDWKEYSIKGKLLEHSFYIDGKFDRFYVEYNNDGKKRAESFYNDGIVQYITLFDTLGKVIKKNKFEHGTGKYETSAFTKKTKFIKGKMVSGERNGKFVFLHPNGKESSVTNYKFGTRHGAYVNYHYNQKIYQKGEYKNGNKVGTWKTYHRNGKLSSVMHYVDGNLVGKVVRYYDNGKLKEVVHIDEYGEEHGMDTNYYDNGVISYIIPIDHGFYHGSYIVHDRAGEPMYKKFFNGDQFIGYSYMRNGKWVPMIPLKADSKVKAKYKSGKQSVVYNMRANQKSGSWKSFHSNGKLWEEINYLYGDYHGIYKRYHDNGQLAFEGTYKNGNREGVHKWYNKKGKLIGVKSFYDDSYNGTNKYYNKKGRLLQTIKFYHGNALKIKNH